jgi:hypothetical protein
MLPVPERRRRLALFPGRKRRVQALWRRVLAVADECGWHITVDAFASTEKAFTPRFFARYADPLNEEGEAVTCGDWLQTPYCTRPTTPFWRSTLASRMRD